MKLAQRITAIALLLCCACPCAQAASEAEAVLVVYNSRMAESKEVADHYAQRRGVPKAQVIGFPMSRLETVTRGQYEAQLERPLLKHLEEKGLFTFEKLAPNHKLAKGRFGLERVSESKIRYLVLCYGSPLRISEDSTIKEEVAASMPEPLRKNEAAVDSELSVLPIKRLRAPRTGPILNPIYRTTNSFLIHPTNNILMVARLDGPSPKIAMGLVDKAIQAETNGLWGRAYFDARGITEGNTLMGDDMFRRAAQGSRVAGFETFIDDHPPTFAEPFWMSHTAIYGGWYDSHVSGPFKVGEVDFMPGAIAYHLHSFNASTVRHPKTHWVGPLLDLGVTVTFGTVYEPYLSGTIDYPEFLKRIITLQHSYGEAAYASSRTISWMTTFVGDPLYRPFKKKGTSLHAELEARKSDLIEWSHLRFLNFALNRGANVDKAVAFLLQDTTAPKSAVLQEKLGDLYYSQKKIDEFAKAYEAALKLDPPRRQKFRLLENLGVRLSEAGKTAEAKSAFERFVEAFPEHPNTPAIKKRIEGL
jgi:uncharacterized protein (TIGR03790 family)